MLRVSAFQLDLERLPARKHKLALLNAIEKSRKALPLTAVLKVLQLSGSRYHAWARAVEVCSLDDRPSCPRSIPQRLTIDEIRSIKHMVLSRAHRHMSIRALALHAQRIGEVFAHPGTWSKLIRARGWRRPRTREYPTKPTRGVRATRPNEAWHIDTTIIRLLDGTKAYLHAVIDNYSRKILAWKLADTMTPDSTVAVLLDAAERLDWTHTNVIMDSGSENVNETVDAFFDGSTMQRILAQVDVSYSNSMIEAW